MSLHSRAVSVLLLLIMVGSAIALVVTHQAPRMHPDVTYCPFDRTWTSDYHYCPQQP